MLGEESARLCGGADRARGQQLELRVRRGKGRRRCHVALRALRHRSTRSWLSDEATLREVMPDLNRRKLAALRSSDYDAALASEYDGFVPSETGRSAGLRELRRRRRALVAERDECAAIGGALA